jgi:ketosteroid isomerase-like protein
MLIRQTPCGSLFGGVADPAATSHSLYVGADQGRREAGASGLTFAVRRLAPGKSCWLRNKPPASSGVICMNKQKGESAMSNTPATETREIIEGYFSSLKNNVPWEPFLSDDLTFTSFTSLIKPVQGKAAYLEATTRFYSTIRSVAVNSLLVDGTRACALTHYQLQPPAGPAFRTDIAEIFKVRGNKIASLDIYFDSAPFPKQENPRGGA